MIKKSIWIFLVLFIFVASSAFAAPFQNGDFSSGFTGWAGEIIDSSYPPTTVTVEPNTSSYFDIVSPNNQARISLDDTYWNNTLYQDFDMDTIGSGWNMELSFWIKWAPTDSTYDGLSATLYHQNSGDVVDLLLGISTLALVSGTNVTIDITSFAQNHGGEQAELAFTLYDLDYDTRDMLNVDNISFTKTPTTPVPEPSMVLLLASGLWGLGFFRKIMSDPKGYWFVHKG